MTDGMLDLVFDLGGGMLPLDYRVPLWGALLQHAPRLADDARVGVLPLRTAEGNGNWLLSKRAKLVLRVPQSLQEHAAGLVGIRLEIAEGWLALGQCKAREIEPYPTLHAPLVASEADEESFIGGVRAELAAMQVVGNLICGKAQTQPNGYSLVIHDLKPEASLRLQARGLGGQRGLGCGVFVHYKLISGLE